MDPDIGYYDGIPTFIYEMTPEEIELALEKEIKRLDEINKNISDD